MSFGRLEKPTGHRPMSEINVTPLVDVLLVLLVIFIVAAPIMASRLALELPQSSPAAMSSDAGVAVKVSIGLDAAGQAFWDDQPVNVEQLGQRLADAARRDPATEVQLRADTAVSYGRVVQVIALAQAAGLSRIGFVADPAALAPSTPAR
jgi:biopolymer transport protein ExbD